MTEPATPVVPDLSTPENLYAPPRARVMDAATAGVRDEFYVVAPQKLLLLYVATVGLYSLYWFWRHWKLHAARHGLSIWPIARALFSIFFAHSLFKEFQHRIERNGTRYVWSPMAWATLYVIAAIATRILDRMAWYGIGMPITDLLGIASMGFVALCLYRAQIAANAACADPGGTRNRRLTIANWLWIVFGLLFWSLWFVGMLISFEESTL